MPLAGATARLPRLIGIGRAKEFLYFGNRVGGEAAHRIGLINKVVPQGQEVEEARRWAAELSNSAPLSLRMIKAAVQQGMQMGLKEALEYEARLGAELIHSQDLVEGTTAFVEKRKPVFKGR
jgi:enoyl-CoA hydratase